MDKLSDLVLNLQELQISGIEKNVSFILETSFNKTKWTVIAKLVYQSSEDIEVFQTLDASFTDSLTKEQIEKKLFRIKHFILSINK